MSNTELTIDETQTGTFVSAPEVHDATIFPKISQKLALDDILQGLSLWRIWLMLAYQDIKLRYRRSVLGPFWITISMAITVYSMGYLYSHLFHANVYEYFPYLVAGMLGWSLVSTTLTDVIDTFTTSEGMLKQVKLPYSLYLHRIIARNMIIFFHNIFVIVPVLIVFHNSARVDWHLLLLIPGLMIIYLNAMSYGLAVAMIGARYRDISQIIKSMISVIFFLTPVMWRPSILPANKQFIALFNPFYSLIEMIRSPLIGKTPTLTNYLVVIFITLLGCLASFYLFTSRRSRIVYWI